MQPGSRDAGSWAGAADGGAYAADAGAPFPPAADGGGVAAGDAGHRDDGIDWDLDPSAFAGAGERVETGGPPRWLPPGPGEHFGFPDAGDAPDAAVDAGASE